MRQPGRPPVWIDCNPAHLEALQPIFGLHSLAIEDCHNQKQRPKLESYPDHEFLVFNRVDYEPGAAGRVTEANAVEARSGRRTLRAHELDVFIGRDFLITVHREPIPELDTVWAATVERSGAAPPTPIAALFRLLDELVDGYFPLLDRLEKELDAAEETVLRRPRVDPLPAIFHLRRQALVLRRLLGPQRDAISALLRSDVPAGDGDRASLQNVYDHALRVFERGEGFREMVSLLLDAYLTVVGNRTNDTMRTLTAMSIIFMPLTLLAGVWGMNFRYMPELEAPWGYPFALGSMLLVGGGLLAWLRRRGWL